MPDGDWYGAVVLPGGARYVLGPRGWSGPDPAVVAGLDAGYHPRDARSSPPAGVPRGGKQVAAAARALGGAAEYPRYDPDVIY